LAGQKKRENVRLGKGGKTTPENGFKLKVRKGG